MMEMGYPLLQPIPLAGDNQGSIFVGQNAVVKKRLKHIDICWHYIHQEIERKKVEMFFIPGEDNPADMFTKTLPRIKFERFRSQLGLHQQNHGDMAGWRQPRQPRQLQPKCRQLDHQPASRQPGHPCPKSCQLS
jgi:hypothetical protein